MTDPAINKLLLPFCITDPDAARYPALAAPFIVGGYLFATDGRCAVAVPCDGPDTTERVPNVMALFKPIIAYKGATVEAPYFEPCICLENLQREDGDYLCDSCWGCGRETCPHCDRDHDCDSCGGCGRFNEHNARVFYCRCGVEVCGIKAWSRYYELIHALPGVRFHAPSSHVDQLWFYFDGGGVGVVMSYSPKFVRPTKTATVEAVS